MTKKSHYHVQRDSRGQVQIGVPLFACGMVYVWIMKNDERHMMLCVPEKTSTSERFNEKVDELITLCDKLNEWEQECGEDIGWKGEPEMKSDLDQDIYGFGKDTENN